MRKVIAILFTFFLLFNLAGYYLFYQLRLNEVKVAMKAALRSNKHHGNTVTFSFSAKEAKTLEWEDSHEFSYGGEMYDVIEINHTGDRVIIKCINDKVENELLKQYAKSFDGAQQKDKCSTIALIKLVTNVFVPAKEVTVQSILSKQHFQFPFYNRQLASLERIILTPPPQIV